MGDGGTTKRITGTRGVKFFGWYRRQLCSKVTLDDKGSFFTQGHEQHISWSRFCIFNRPKQRNCFILVHKEKVSLIHDDPHNIWFVDTDVKVCSYRDTFCAALTAILQKSELTLGIEQRCDMNAIVHRQIRRQRIGCQ